MLDASSGLQLHGVVGNKYIIQLMGIIFTCLQLVKIDLPTRTRSCHIPLLNNMYHYTCINMTLYMYHNNITLVHTHVYY